MKKGYCFCLLIVFVFFLAFAVSCNGRGSLTVGDIDVPEHDMSVVEDDRIFGRWKSCDIYSGGYMVQANVCPEVVFSKGGEGYVRYPSGITEGFTWTFSDRKLSIMPARAFDGGVFADTLYDVSITYNRGTYNAQLDALSAEEKVYLAR